MHEETKAPIPSNRKFGWFFFAVFGILSIWLAYKSNFVLTLGSAVLAALFALLSVLAPKLLQPLNLLWHRLGLFLGRIVSPIVLGLIFFVLITPVSLVTRLFGRDELKLKKRLTGSYWVNRSPPGPRADSFKNQF